MCFVHVEVYLWETKVDVWYWLLEQYGDKSIINECEVLLEGNWWWTKRIIFKKSIWVPLEVYRCGINVDHVCYSVWVTVEVYQWGLKGHHHVTGCYGSWKGLIYDFRGLRYSKKFKKKMYMFAGTHVCTHGNESNRWLKVAATTVNTEVLAVVTMNVTTL
jgi:hypothetical protein